MFRTFKTIVDIFWIMDVLDLPFMEMFDTTYPINGLFWFAIIVILCFEEAFELKSESEKRQIMQVKIFRDLDIEKLEKEINEFIDNDYISVKDIKVTTDVVYDKYDKNMIPTHISLWTTVAVTYEENN